MTFAVWFLGALVCRVFGAGVMWLYIGITIIASLVS